MSFSRVHSAQIELLSGRIVSVEVDTARGMNAFTIVGLGDRAVDEARDRVGSALKNAGFESPKTKNQKTVVSLSPADLKKEGAHFDLAIAIGFLLAEGMRAEPLDRTLFVGELALDGAVRPVRGMLAIALAARREGFTTLFVPYENAEEASLVETLTILPVRTLREAADHIEIERRVPAPTGIENAGEEAVLSASKKIAPFEGRGRATCPKPPETDLADIVSQESAKRGLMIAAAGGHNILLYGPPGTGKTMLARALAGILPELSTDDAMEVTSIHSITAGAGAHVPGDRTPPFRSPHHTSSYVSIIGGGATPKPGEVTLAHRGVLFLDEFPEFDRRVMESLREPLEEHFVSIARSKGSAVFPAQFLFVAAMNPCPCGFRGSKVRSCACTAADLARYRRKLSGPLMDRIDMALYVGEIAYEKLASAASEESGAPRSLGVRAQVIAAREKASVRSAAANCRAKTNSEIRPKELSKLATLNAEAERTLNESATRLGLSARAYHRMQKLARTIADLAESDEILPEHILEAARYRPQMESIA